MMENERDRNNGVPEEDTNRASFDEAEDAMDDTQLRENMTAEDTAAEEVPQEYSDPETDKAAEDGQLWDPDEEPENLAEIAERILGARHSKASTAAPIRTRGDREREEKLKAALQGQAPERGSAAVPDPGSQYGSRPPVYVGMRRPDGGGQSIPVMAQTGDVPAAHPGTAQTGEIPALHPGTARTGEVPAANPVMTQTGDVPAVHPVMTQTGEVPAVNPAAFMNTAERQALREERERAAAEKKAREEAARKKKVRTTVTACVCAVLLLGGAVGIGIGLSGRNRSAKADEEDPVTVGQPSEGEEQENAGTAALPSDGDGSDQNAETQPGAETTAPGGETGEQTDAQSGEQSGEQTPEPGGTDVTGPDDNAPDDNSPDNTVPDDNAAENTAPEDNAAGSTAPDDANGPEENGTGSEDGAGTDSPGTEPVQTPAGETSQPPAEEDAPVSPFTVRIEFYNRDPIVVETPPTSIGAILAEKGIVLKDGEQTSVGLWDWLTESVTCSVDLFEYVYVDETVSVPYGTEEIGVDTIPRGTTQAAQAGVNGEKVNHYYVAKKNGEEFNRRLEWEEVTVLPVNEQVYVGVGGWFTGADGVAYSYSWRRLCPATYYTAYGLTWLGTDASSRTVAADFGNFPLGTKLYVKNDRYDCGYRVVEDTGERLDPWQVDIWMDAGDPNYPLMVQEEYVYDMWVYFLD